MNEHHDISNPAIKAGTAIAAAGIAGYSWSDIAAILAAVYTTLLIAEWVWKKARAWFQPKDSE